MTNLNITRQESERQRYDQQADQHLPPLLPSQRTQYRRDRAWYIPGTIRGVMSQMFNLSSINLAILVVVEVVTIALINQVLVGFIVALGVTMVISGILGWNTNKGLWIAFGLLAFLVLASAFYYWLTFWS